jgi:hypothetical protein
VLLRHHAQLKFKVGHVDDFLPSMTCFVFFSFLFLLKESVACRMSLVMWSQLVDGGRQQAGRSIFFFFDLYKVLLAIKSGLLRT